MEPLVKAIEGAPPAPSRRRRLTPGPLALLSLLIVAGIIAVVWSALSKTDKPPAQWLAKGGYPCTAPDPKGGAPIASGQILSAAGAGHYVLQTPRKLRTEVGSYSSKTVRAGQYVLAFTGGPLGGVRGEFLLTQRDGGTVSYVVLSGGRFDGQTCTLIP